MRLIEDIAKCRQKKLFYKGTLWQVEEGGRVETERRLEGQQFTKLGRKYQQYEYLQSINSDEHLPQNPFTGNFFR
jgi:hypothetical protein